jgi:hypothetical protein
MPAPAVTTLPDEYLEHLDRLTKLVNQMSQAIVAAYELSDALSIGGPTGIYTLANPFGTPCEWSIEYFSAFGAASAVISTQSNLPQLADNTVFGASAATSNMPNTGQAAVVLMSTANLSIPGSPNWYPLANSENLTMAVTAAANHSALLTVQFRRRKTPSGVVSF